MDRTVNLGGSGATLTWGTSTFNPAIFQLSSDAANAMVDIQNGINLNGSRVVQVANGTARVDARLSGNITGNGNFEKRGAGALELTGNNSWSGLTIVDSGQLILSSANALPGGNLRMVNAAILVLNQGDFSRSVGNGTNQIEFQQVVNLGSGFGARGADRVVNLGGNGETLTWNSGLFLQNSQRLYLSSDASDAMVDFQNALNLNGQTQTVWVNNGAGVVDGRISGQISNGGLTKLGDGLLELTATNTYTGVTQQAGGTLRLGLNSISAQSNLTILRGAVELVGGGNFTRSLGSGAGQVRFTGSDSPAGFSAKGGDLTISFNGNSNELIWNNTSGFLANIGLLLGAESADSTTILTNALSLGPANQTIIREIQSMNGSADVDARLTGNVTSANGTNQGLRKTGTGTLETTGVLSYTGATFVDAGELRVSGSITNTSGISVASEARFHYAGATSLNRSVSVEGGSFIYNSAAAFTGNLNLTEGTLGGSGNLTGTSLTIGQGIQISPGNSSGTLITGSQTWQNGGTYVWEIKDLNGTAGAPVGWDLLSLSGTLSLTELTDHFTIQVVANTLAGWNPNLQQDWLILTASGISDFDANRFQMDTSSFQETLNGNFAVDASNNTLLLTYTPVPEPGTLMLAIFAAALIGMGRLRHGKKQIV
jgi:autotransporter-associated beta strand protein